MSMNNKQRWMGGVVLLGGGVLLAALLLKGNEEIGKDKDQVKIVQPAPKTAPTQNGEIVALQPLAVDVATEKKLLEEQRHSREKAVAEQEARAAEFLKMQQEAEAAAARKAAEEYAEINARRAAVQESSDNIPPELIEDDKTKQQQKTDVDKKVAEADKKAAEAKTKAEADKKAAEAKAEADKRAAAAKAKAEADKKAAEAKAKAEADKKAAAAKAKADADKKAAEVKAKADADKKAADAKKKADADKARDLMENGDKNWMVQVALAANQANADAVVSKLRAKGYKVTTSPTSKGIRIMVGPSKDRDAADATRKKITADQSLNMKSAWVIDWVPLDQR